MKKAEEKRILKQEVEKRMKDAIEADTRVQQLRQYLETMHEVKQRAMDPSGKDKRRATLEGFVLEHGRKWTGKRRPPGVRKQQDRACFRNAQRHLIHHLNAGDLTLSYCEGYAVHGDGIPVLHGWLVDWQYGVIDLTWRAPETSVYWGVVFRGEYVRSAVSRTCLWTSLLDAPETKWEVLSGRVPLQQALFLDEVPGP